MYNTSNSQRLLLVWDMRQIDFTSWFPQAARSQQGGSTEAAWTGNWLLISLRDSRKQQGGSKDTARRQQKKRKRNWKRKRKRKSKRNEWEKERAKTRKNKYKKKLKKKKNRKKKREGKTKKKSKKQEKQNPHYLLPPAPLFHPFIRVHS